MSTKHKPINGWTKARMIKQVRAKLPKDGSRCIAEDGTCCLYRDSSGHTCAAGAFIPDEDYRTSMEDNNIKMLLDFGKVGPDVLPLDPMSMFLLQNEHDNCPDGHSAAERVVKWIEENVEDNQ